MPVVIPAKAGIHGKNEAWIPAFAGMTREKWRHSQSQQIF
jgi:hypothetical protein